MSLQNQFERFNENIRLSSKKLEELREKRNKILDKLRNNKDLPSFEEFGQGSYRMGTEVEPIDKDYDIDVGLRFNVNKNDYEDPLTLKKQIRDILKNHTEYGAQIKTPCVTVTYKKDGETAYHVDIVTYTYEDKENKGSQLYLARGKEFAKTENIKWEKADPLGLIDEIENRYSGEDKNQYKRIIRYLKRWKNLNFTSDGNNEVPGIGITLLAYNLFLPSKDYDYLEEKYKYNDLNALIDFVEDIKNKFISQYDIESGDYKYSISLNLPVEPYTDVFSKMTLNQTNNFRNKICKLYDDLIIVKDEADIIEQCKKLNQIFGENFEVPEKKEESKLQKNFIPPSSATGIK